MNCDVKVGLEFCDRTDTRLCQWCGPLCEKHWAETLCRHGGEHSEAEGFGKSVLRGVGDFLGLVGVMVAVFTAPEWTRVLGEILFPC
jgi:hypothetical protein